MECLCTVKLHNTPIFQNVSLHNEYTTWQLVYLQLIYAPLFDIFYRMMDTRLQHCVIFKCIRTQIYVWARTTLYHLLLVITIKSKHVLLNYTAAWTVYKKDVQKCHTDKNARIIIDVAKIAVCSALLFSLGDSFIFTIVSSTELSNVSSSSLQVQLSYASFCRLHVKAVQSDIWANITVLKNV